MKKHRHITCTHVHINHLFICHIEKIKRTYCIHIVYMNARYKLPYCFSGVQWSPTLASSQSKMPWSYWSHARWAWLAWNPWRIPHCLPWRKWGLSQKGNLGSLLWETWQATEFYVFCILFDRFQYDSITTASNGHFFHHRSHAEERICRCN